MPNKLRWTDYLDRLPGEPTDRAIAKAAGVDPATLHRWRKGQYPKPEHVTKVARAFGRNPLSALTGAGYLTLDEMDDIIKGAADLTVHSLEDFSTVELLNEVSKRVTELEERANGVG